MGLINWLSGYLLICVKGDFPERFCNLCMQRGILIKNAVKKDDSVYLYVGRRGFSKMLIPKKRSGCSVKIVKKLGLPFMIKKWSKRKMLIAGGLLFFLILFTLNSFIWTIRIDGNENITDEEIKIIANYCGLRQGVLKYKLDEKKFSRNALKCEPRLSWIWPEVKGTVLYIHVREKAMHPAPIDVKEPYSVVASRSGIIDSVTVKRGWAVVKEGDSVVVGDVLIKGTAEDFEPLHAMGEVLASYWVETGGIAETKKEIVTLTGREKTYYAIKIGSFGMNFRFGKKAPFENYLFEKDKKDLVLFSDIPLPIAIEKSTYREVNKEYEDISLDEAISQMAEKIENEFIESLSGETKIMDITQRTEVISSQKAKVSLIIRCQEDIAISRKE